MTVIRLDVKDPESVISAIMDRYDLRSPLIALRGRLGTVCAHAFLTSLVVLDVPTADYINAWDERGKHVLFVGDIPDGVDAVTVEDGPALILRVLALLA